MKVTRLVGVRWLARARGEGGKGVAGVGGATTSSERASNALLWRTPEKASMCLAFVLWRTPEKAGAQRPLWPGTLLSLAPLALARQRSRQMGQRVIIEYYILQRAIFYRCGPEKQGVRFYGCCTCIFCWLRRKMLALPLTCWRTGLGSNLLRFSSDLAAAQPKQTDTTATGCVNQSVSSMASSDRAQVGTI